MLHKLGLAFVIVLGSLAALLGASSMTMAAEPLRITGSVDGLAREDAKAKILLILFPDNVVQMAKDIKSMSDVGFGAEFLPKPSLGTTQVIFSRSRATLTERGKVFLDDIGAALQTKQGAFVKVLIECHTFGGGSAGSSRSLSRNRAEKIRTYLLSNYGIVDIEAAGRGSDALKDNSNPGAAINGRIEFVITLPGQDYH